MNDLFVVLNVELNAFNQLKKKKQIARIQTWGSVEADWSIELTSANEAKRKQ